MVESELSLQSEHSRRRDDQMGMQVCLLRTAIGQAADKHLAVGGRACKADAALPFKLG